MSEKLIPWTKEELMKANDKLIKRNQRYKQALEFYADEDNYFRRVIPPVIESEVVQDKGEKARKALKGVGG